MGDGDKECDGKVVQSSWWRASLSYNTTASNLINTDLAAPSGLDATLTSPDALVQVGILSDAYCDRRHRFIDMTGSAPESGNVWFVVTDTMLLGHVY